MLIVYTPTALGAVQIVPTLVAVASNALETAALRAEGTSVVFKSFEYVAVIPAGPPLVVLNDPPVVVKAVAVVTGAYKEIAAPGKTTIVCAVPEDVSLATKPSDSRELPAPNKAVVVTGIPTAAPVLLLAVATNKEPSTVPVVVAAF